MAITWHLVSVNLDDKKDRVSLTIQEGIDDVPTPDMFYTSRPLARTLSGVKNKIFEDLKEQILTDRVKKTKEDTLEALIDLTDFETFVNL